MKSCLNKIGIIFCLMLCFISLGIVSVNAAEANIIASSAKVGENITVTVTFPNECFGYEGKIKVVFADGTEKVSSKYSSVNYSGLDNSFSRTITYTVKADVVGNGTAKMVDLVLGDKNGNKINTKDTVQTGFKVTTSENTNTTTETTNTVDNTVLNNVSTKDTNTVGNSVTEEKKEEKKEEIKVTIKEEVKKTMYVAEDVPSCHVRNADSKKAEIIGGMKSGAEVEVTGITSNGWYRIKYYGETAYVGDVLTDKKPEKKENEVTNEVKNDTNNETINETVVENKQDEIDSLKNTVGVIPEVGNNIADVLFVISTIMGIGYVFYISYNNKEV